MTDDNTNETDTTDEQHTTTGQGDDGEQDPATTDSPGPIATRRGILTSAGILGLLGLGAGTATADASGQIGTSSDPLNKLYTAELNGGVTGDQSLTNIAGSGLTIDGSGNLKTSGGSSKWSTGDNSNLLEPSSKDGIEVDKIADNGAGSVSMQSPLARTTTTAPSYTTLTTLEVGEYFVEGGDTDIRLPSSPVAGEEHVIKNNASKTLDIRGNGNDIDGSSTISLSNDNDARKVIYDGSEWHTLSEFSAGGGSTPSKLKTSNSSVTAVEVLDGDTSVAAGSNNSTPPNVISGHPNNNTGGSSVKGVTISGGSKDYPNKASANYATVGGGEDNEATDTKATVAGGGTNSASTKATVSGGTQNTASGTWATVGGGSDNTASGSEATVPGGDGNTADGIGSFAAGKEADTNGKDGAFVWGDHDINTGVTAQATDEVRFQATGGFVIENSAGSTESVTLDGGLPSGSGSSVVIDGSGNLKKATSASASQLQTGGVTAMRISKGGTDITNADVGDSAPNIVGGHENNHTTNQPEGVTISGGGVSGFPDEINIAEADFTTISGGKNNTASAKRATVGGGTDNAATGKESTVAGGGFNTASGEHATVPGGTSCTADGKNSFAAGDTANTNGKNGAFVWGDTSIQTPDAGAENQVYFQASGDFVIEFGDLRPASDDSLDLGTSSKRWSKVYAQNGTIQTSDARLKRNVSEVSSGLEKVSDMRPVSFQWDDDSDSDTHLGFLAQEMEETVPEAVDRPDDEDGHLGMTYQTIIPVVVSAVQEQQRIITDLEAHIDAQETRIEDQRDRIERLESNVDNKDVALDALREALDDKGERIDDLEAENEQLRERNAELEDRLATVEAELGIDATASRRGVADD